jgi:hypothetical protein
VQVRKLWVSDFKSVDAVVHWADVVVLFGKNDAGKTNILEAITAEWLDERPGRPPFVSVWFADLVGTAPGYRVDPLSGESSRKVDVLIELEYLDLPDAEDRDLLARLLQIRHVPPRFPYYDPGLEKSLAAHEADTLDTHSESRFPPAQLRWGTDAKNTFCIGCAGAFDAEWAQRDLGPLEAALDALREQALAAAPTGDRSWPQIEFAFRTLLDCCLSSRWLRAGTSGVTWMTPRLDELSDKVKAAAALVLEHDSSLPVVGPFAEAVATGDSTQLPFIEIHEHRFTPWRVIRNSASAERLTALASTVEEFVRDQIEFMHFSGDPPYPQEPWLIEEEDGRFALSSLVTSLCALLSQTATQLAPAFISESYEIVVEPLSPAAWRDYGGRRLRLALRHHGESESFDLEVVGSGFAVWAALSLEETLRKVNLDLEDMILERMRVAHEDEEDDDEEDDHEVEVILQKASRKDPPETGRVGVLYVLDEPERHLHPRAQEVAAAWVAGLADRGASVIVASHALPFLALPTDEVEYVLVTRDPTRTTRTTAITHDVFGQLDLFAEEAGVQSSAQLLQLLRGFILVEGAHDADVLNHFFHERLERARVRVLPTRGAKKVRSLLEAELLAGLDIPIVILFDDIQVELLEAESPPSQRDIAAFELWHLLQHWPDGWRRPGIVSFPLPDVFAALPDECVRRVVVQHGGDFAAWDQVVSEYRSGGHDAFKKFFIETSGLPAGTDPSELLTEILETCRERPRVEIDGAVTRALDLLDMVGTSSSLEDALE